MSFYEDASLVLIPSGYKTSKVYCAKPTDGAADLSFTRSNDTATRVNSAGLIEKVRTNVILQSNTFSTTWTNVNTTETIGQAGYDGTNNAWLLDITGSTDNQRIVQSVSLSGLQTFSVYAKAGTLGWMRLRLASATSPDVYFDLVNGALGGGTGSGRIEPAGNGFYRCSIFADNATTEVRIHLATGNGNISQTSGNIIIQNAQLETGDIATDYIATTSAAVSVGPVANVPRLDYLNSSCPRLLLEPQTTALTSYSEQIDNAGWGKQNVSITANNTASPSGYVDADKIVEDTANSTHFVSNNFTASTATSHTFSVFAKMGERKYLCFAGSNVGAFSATYDLEAGTVIGATGATASIEDYGNGWYRCVAVKVIASGGGVAVRIGAGTTATVAAIGFTQSYLGDGTSGLFIWGVNVTATAYPQSYVPTLGAAVTRGADAASKTGISSLLNDSEGTLFIDVQGISDGGDSRRVSISDGTTGNRVSIELDETAGRIVTFYSALGTLNGSLTVDGITQTESHKIALTYSATESKLFIDGVFEGVDTTIPATPTGLSVLEFANGAGALPMEGFVSQILYFPTALTNAQLAELTTL